MTKRLSSLLVSLQLLLLTPYLALGAHVDKDFCADHPRLRSCVVSVPEHWGAYESIAFFALTLVAFWVVVRLKILRTSDQA
jgi:hypothetical protein